jgi:glycosyltransferase involved in cell wall biosynthesis
MGLGGEPAISVLMPVRAHHPAFFGEAIRSLLEQTCDRWELLLIGERAVAELEHELGERASDSWIRVVSNEGRKLAGALNTGMRHAHAAFVGILFADDLWSSDAVEVLARNIRDHPDADFFHSSRRVIDTAGRPVSDVYPARRDVSLEDFRRFAPVKHLLCWRRELALSIGGLDESLNSVGPDDLDFPWTMAEHGARFLAVPQCLYTYRDHRECFRLTTHLPRKVHERELRRIFRKHGLPRRMTRRRIRDARHSFLRQCLYSSSLQARVWQLLGMRSGAQWREYRQ